MTAGVAGPLSECQSPAFPVVTFANFVLVGVGTTHSAGWFFNSFLLKLNFFLDFFINWLFSII